MITQKKGITLVALVITIIVLLILAGVSIALVIGDNGIISKTAKAKKNTIIEQTKEQLRLAISAAQVDGEGTILYSDLVTELNNQFGTGNYSISNEAEDEWEIVVTTSEGNVTEIVLNNSLSGTIQFVFVGNTYEVARETTWEEWVLENPSVYGGPSNETTREIDCHGQPYFVFIRSGTNLLSLNHAYSESTDSIIDFFEIRSNNITEQSEVQILGSDTIKSKTYEIIQE